MSGCKLVQLPRGKFAYISKKRKTTSRYNLPQNHLDDYFIEM